MGKVKLSIPGFFGGLLAVQTGVMQGEAEARERQRREALQHHSQMLQNLSALTGLERDQSEADLSPLRMMMGLPNLAPESQQALGQELMQRQQGQSRPAAAMFTAYLQSRMPGGQQQRMPGSFPGQGGGAPYPSPGAVPSATPLPGATRSDRPLPTVKFRDPRLEEAYTGPIAMRERALQSGEITDEHEASYITRELESLRTARDAGRPLNQASVTGFAFPVPVRSTLPAFKVDKAARTFELSRLKTTADDLRKFVAQYPQGTEERRFAEERVTPYLSRLGGLKVESREDLDAVRAFLSDPDLNRLRFSSSAGTENLQQRKRRESVQRHMQGVEDFLGGPTKAPIPAHVARHQLPARLKIERDLLGGEDGVAPYYSSEEAAINRLEAINNATKDPQLSPAERAKLDQEGDQVAEGIQARLRAGLSPNEEKGRFDQGLRALGAMSIADARTGEGKALFEGLGIAHLWQPGLSGARADKLYDDLLRQAPSFAKLTPEGQNLYLDRLRGASRLTGRPIELPADFVIRLAPTDAAKLAADRSRLQLAGDKLSIAKAQFRLDQSAALLKLQEKQRTSKIAPGDTLLLNASRRQLGSAEKDYTTALGALRKTGDSFWAAFDPEEASRLLQAGEPLRPTVPLSDSGFWSGVDGFFARITGGQTKAQRARSALATREERYRAVAEDLVGKYRLWKAAEEKHTADLNFVATGAGATITPGGKPAGSAGPATDARGIPLMNTGGTNRDKFINKMRLGGTLSEVQIQALAEHHYPTKAKR